MVGKHISVSTVMGEKDAVVIKDEQNQSPTYHPTSVYTEDLYTTATHLNGEHLQNVDKRHRQHYGWISTDAGDSAVDHSKGEEYSQLWQRDRVTHTSLRFRLTSNFILKMGTRF